MARKKDLAGLAALAGAAYLATRGKGDDTAAAPLPAPESSGAETSPVASSAGDVEETPLAKVPDVPRTRRTATPAPSAGGGRGGRGGASAEELASYAESKKPAYETPYDRSRREDREAGRDFDSLVDKLKSKFTSEDTRKPLPLKSTKSETGNAFMGSTGLKKGGSVKGWGIARGARKAKTY